jgi:hypothetical protein
MFSCHIVNNKRNDSKNAFNIDSIKKEELRITLIDDTSQISWIAGNFLSFWTPSTNQLNVIDSITQQTIKENKKEYYKRLTPSTFKNYFRQFSCYIDKNGDSIVFINAMCEIRLNPEPDLKGNYRADWQHEIITVKDGGECFWCLWINFTKRKSTKFVVNGEA